MSINSKLITRRSISLTTLLTCIFLLSSFSIANGQEDDWTQHKNLSQSGATNAPTIVRDATDKLYAFWQNRADGYVIAVHQNGDWGEPTPAEPPFGTRAYSPDLIANQATPRYEPVLVANNDSGIHGIWIDDDSRVSHSRFVSGDITSLAAWSLPTLIDSSAVETAAIVDSGNRLHVAYLSQGDGETVSAGIYHRISLDQGVTWSGPQAVYSSSYFRQASADTAEISFFEGSDGSIFLTWDDQFKEQVFTASVSGDFTGEFSWSTPQIIDSRSQVDSPDSQGPAKIKGVEFDSTLHLFWIAGHDGTDCALYTRQSTNRGQDWSFPEQLTDNTAECPSSIELLQNDNRLLLFTSNLGTVDLRFWSEDRWSQPLLQDELLEFLDPVNFRPVTATCRYQLQFHEDQLFAVGCGENVAADIWATSRPVSGLVAPAHQQSVWGELGTVSGEDNLILSSQIISDSAGGLHAIWVQNGQGYTKNTQLVQPGKGIYYSRGDGVQWASSNQILTSGGTTENPAFVYNRSNNNLLVAWEDSQNQQILFSQASSTNAFNSTDWSEPAPVPAPFANPSEPAMAISPEGIIYIVYTVPFNENRGFYLIQSNDSGFSWSEPAPVLADTTPFDVFLSPELIVSNDGTIHIAFLNQLEARESARNEMYYVRSSQILGGSEVEWSAPVQILNSLLQNNNVFSHELNLDETGAVHLVWQEWNETQVNLWGQFSPDNGLTWSEGAQISGFGTPVGNLDLNFEPSKGLHLNQLMLGLENGRDILTAQHWFFSDGNWLLQSPASFSDVEYFATNTTLAAGVSSENMISLIFSGTTFNDGRPIQGLYSTNRALDDITISTSVDGGGQIAPTQDSEMVDEMEEVAEDMGEEPVTEVGPDLSVIFADADGPSLNSIQSFSTNSPVVVGATLALVIGAILLLVVGGYFGLKFIASRR